LLTSVAPLAAWNVMLPEFPVPGWVMFAVTPLGIALVDSVMLPVKLLRLRFIVTVCELPPGASATELGLTLLILMLMAELIVRAKAPDVPPPGVGLATVMEALPAVAMSLAGTRAVSCVLLA
jgi:hypothetical protein